MAELRARHAAPFHSHVWTAAAFTSFWTSTVTPRAASYAMTPRRTCGPGPTVDQSGCSIAHRLEQPSWLRSEPSSHASPGSRTPLPQTSADRQSAEQPSPPTVFPSSHASAGSTMPSPHGGPQSAGHPSPETLFPSSQVSPGSRRLLPQVSDTQIGLSPAIAQRSPDGQTPPVPHALVRGCRQPPSTNSASSVAPHLAGTMVRSLIAS